MLPQSQLKYHPNRYMASRPFAKALLASYATHIGRDIPTIDAFERLFDQYVQYYNHEIERIPPEYRLPGSLFLKNDFSLLMHNGAFVANGRNIFDYPPDMSQMFLLTDVDAVPVASLKFPYRVFYLYFGTQSELDLWTQGYYVDGAYINLNNNMLAVLLSTIRTDVDYNDTLSYLLQPDRYYFFSLSLEGEAVSVGDAIEATIMRDDPFSPKIVGGSMPNRIKLPDREVQVIDNRPYSSVETAAENLVGFEVFKRAMKLVINGLCYITAYRPDTTTRYPEDAPESLVRKLEAAITPKQRIRAQSKLLALGFTKIHFCGNEFKKQRSFLGAGKETSPHWRRGHWRNQAFGPAFTSHRLIWIMPTIVRKDKGSPKKGHIYLMNESDT